jgi:hypothetical protein
MTPDVAELPPRRVAQSGRCPVANRDAQSGQVACSVTPVARWAVPVALCWPWAAGRGGWCVRVFALCLSFVLELQQNHSDELWNQPTPSKNPGHGPENTLGQPSEKPLHGTAEPGGG